MNEPLNSFETGLLEDLKTEVSQRPARRRRRFMVGGAAALVVGGALTGALLLTPAGATPAYAVTEDAGTGTVTVTVNKLSDAAGLEKALAAHGIHAKVTYNADQTTATLPDGTKVLDTATPPDGTGASTGTGASAGTGEVSGSSPGWDAAAFAKNCGITPTSDPTHFPQVQTTPDHAVITIPAGSIPAGHDLTITTIGGNTALSGLTAGWNGLDGQPCGFGTVTAAARVK